MKIGILTFHCAHNYGAVLQAYGLQEYLKSKGHEVHIIDYRPRYLTKVYHKSGIRCWISKSLVRTCKKLLNEPFLMKTRAKRWDNFDRFINERFNLAPFDEQGSDGYDAVIVGSDQIWNPRITGGKFDKVFFGKGTAGRILAYAASSRFKELTDKERQFFQESLKGIDAISVREDSLRHLLQPLTEKKIETAIDPTLLAGCSAFNPIACKPDTKRPYVFIYNIDPQETTHEMARRIAKQIDGDVFELTASLASHKQADGIKRVDDISPEQLLGYIRYATCVITTSFHGTALSLLFQRPFYAVRQKSNADLRVESLLEKIGLTDHFINKDERPDFLPIDYATINERIEAERTVSKTFLLKGLTRT